MMLWHSYHHKHHGRHIKVLLRLYEEKLQNFYLEELHFIVSDSPWAHVKPLIKRILPAANPQTYRPF